MNRLVRSSALFILALPGLYLIYQALFPFNPYLIIDAGSTVPVSLITNTLVLIVVSCTIALFIGTVTSLLVVFYQFKGRRLLETILFLPIVFPPYVVAMVYNEIFHGVYGLHGNIETLSGCGLVFGLTLYPYVFMIAKITFYNQSTGYIEIGKSLGLSRGRRITTILLPMALPSFFLSVLLVCMEVVSDYGTVHTLGIRTITVGIYDIWFSMFNQKLAIQISLVMLILPVVAVALFARYTRNIGFYNPTNRPRTGDRHHLYGLSALFAFGAASIPPLLGFFIPVIILVKWCLETLHRININTLYGDIYHTVLLAGLTGLVCIIFGLLFSYANRDDKTSIGLRAATWMINLNYAMPGIAIAIALLFLTGSLHRSFLGGWMSNTMFFLLFACIIRYLCFAFFSIETGMQKISFHLDEAASSIGKSRLFSLFRIHLPLLKRSIIIGGILVFINTSKELTMSLVLQPFHYSSLAIRVFNYAGVDMLKESAVFAISLALITIYPVLSINRWLRIEELE